MGFIKEHFQVEDTDTLSKEQITVGDFTRRMGTMRLIITSYDF